MYCQISSIILTTQIKERAGKSVLCKPLLILLKEQMFSRASVMTVMILDCECTVTPAFKTAPAVIRSACTSTMRGWNRP
jgi:hypothetical protein